VVEERAIRAGPGRVAAGGHAGTGRRHRAAAAAVAQGRRPGCLKSRLLHSFDSHNM
jgi:hypothetical protein